MTVRYRIIENKINHISNSLHSKPSMHQRYNSFFARVFRLGKDDPVSDILNFYQKRAKWTYGYPSEMQHF